MITVAIAEDHELVRSGIALMVDRFANMKVVVTASNGYELIEHFKTIKELPDVAILDVNMPEMNGYDTAIEIRKHFSEVRILALSMHSNEYCVLKMIQNGTNGYLLKDTRASDLETAINNIYTYGYHYSELAPERTFNKTSNHHRLKGLTQREIDFIRLCCDDTLSIKQIGTKMGITENTAYEYQKKICSKLQISHSRLALAMFAIHNGILEI